MSVYDFARESDADLEEIAKARDLLMKHNQRDSLAYWILVHAYNRVELGHDDMFIRVGRSSRNAVRKLREVSVT